LGFLAPGAVSGAEGPGEPAKEWEEALEPLGILPIQDTGYVRSLETFSQHVMLTLRDKRSYQKRSALVTVLWFLADPDSGRRTPVFKVTHPKLIDVFGGSKVSLANCQDPDTAESLDEAYRRDMEGLAKPVNRLYARIQCLQNLPQRFAIVPRKDEWLSPAQLTGGKVAGRTLPPEVEPTILSTRLSWPTGRG